MNNLRGQHIVIGQGGDAMDKAHSDDVKLLGFALWEQTANEQAYKNGIITRAMYEFAQKEIHKDVARLTAVCYANT